eukprot:CAMPEP_0196661844 /NCGR_PEP_ID=MMETSP1086-20130531/46072_1 /TAXON_ID=77921 /ORGANISM="Cyanoptyche  gloeocystis , Strain SAG4.97" /LENGTH=81 /DNA_ID=CAMNT_0041996931 /DNA_START=170 /DNA_END=412 /DNA_ORIENTATION=+
MYTDGGGWALGERSSEVKLARGSLWARGAVPRAALWLRRSARDATGAAADAPRWQVSQRREAEEQAAAKPCGTNAAPHRPP